jgi:threonine dehydratase
MGECSTLSSEPTPRGCFDTPVQAPADTPPPVTRADIERAAERIAGRVRRTPVMRLEAGAFGVEAELILKLELLQRTGSFKLRGAFIRLLSAEVPPAGVVAASGGNFGLAVACAARETGHPAEIFVPETSPAVKAERIREQGFPTHIIPGYFAEALEAARERAAETGAVLLHAYDQPEVVAGQGTIGKELSDQVPDATTVLVAVGGGGLIAGIASWFAGDVRVIGVEPRRCPTLTEALRAGGPVDIEVGGLAADSLGSRRAGDIAYETARRFVKEVVLVEDDAIADAQRALWSTCRLIVEPGGAAALAALRSGAYRPRRDERVVALISGANADIASIVG